MVSPTAILTAERDVATHAARSELRTAANEVVGQVFYGTLLRQVRSESLKGAYGHGGRGEEVFQAQLDQHLSEQMGKARTTDLADAIVARFERKAAALEAYRRQMTAEQSPQTLADTKATEGLLW